MAGGNAGRCWDHIPDELRVRYDEEFGSIPNAVRIAARRHPSLEAVVDGDTRMTFTDLELGMVDAIRGMIAMGIRPGTRVGLLAPNCARWIVAALGILGAGGVLVPLNTRFTGPETAYILRTSGADALLTVTDFLDNDYLGMLRASDPTLAALDRVIVISGEPGPCARDWASFVEMGRAVPPDRAHAAIDAVSPESLSDIMFTSGTTGHPKGVMLTHGQSLRAHGWLTKAMGFRRGDRFLIIPPFFHTFGYKAGWMSCILHGVTSIPQRVLDIDNLLKTIAGEKVSILLGPPTLFQDLLDAPARGKYDLASLRIACPSAAMAFPELVARIRDELNVENTISAYGLTEATSLVTTTIPGIDNFSDVTTSVGRAAWGVDLRVVDDSGNDVAQGSCGELWVRGYNVMRGYFDDPIRTAEVITPDGWLRTGDLVVMDDRGYVRITGRKKDVVIVGGFNVYPAEVERILAAHPDVAEVAVVGMRDHRMGEVPVAFVVPRQGGAQSENRLRGWARDKIANFKVPRRVIFVGSLPRNASMKVLKGELRNALR